MGMHFQAKGFTRMTPRFLKILLTLFIAVSLTAAVADSALETFSGGGYIAYLLSFTRAFALKGYLWQPFTYPFVAASFGGFNWSFVIQLLFQSALLYALGSAVAERFGEKNLLKLFFFSTLGAALFALPLLSLFPSAYPLAGPDAALYSFFVLYCCLKPETKWLYIGALALTLLSALVEGNITALSTWLVGVVTGYVYGVGFYELTSPFHLPIDALLRRSLPRPKESKIVSLYAKESDDAFLDRMLDKISSDGEESLTPEERRRLDAISHRKKL